MFSPENCSNHLQRMIILNWSKIAEENDEEYRGKDSKDGEIYKT
jgi:hypothetical protein